MRFMGKLLAIKKKKKTVYNAHLNKYHDINDQYVDGVSITYGYPHQHL